jgi:hypothetical protein
LLLQVVLGLLRHVLSRFVQLPFKLFSSFPLILICLFVLDDLALTLVDDLQEEVLHQAQSLLILLCCLNVDIVVITQAHASQLLFQSL